VWFVSAVPRLKEHDSYPRKIIQSWRLKDPYLVLLSQFAASLVLIWVHEKNLEESRQGQKRIAAG
jgi:hypothetical protein